MEYPGYGFYTYQIRKGEIESKKKLKTKTKYIKENAELVYQYLTRKSKFDIGLGYKPDQIIVLGRSIGTGVATYIA